MSSRVLNFIRILLVLAFLVAAAATPTLAEAKTKKSTATKRSAKKMKISFDSSEASTPLDEPLRPRVSQRSYETPGETVRLRAQNIDDIWAANGGGVSTSVPKRSKTKVATKVAAKVPAARKPVVKQVARVEKTETVTRATKIVSSPKNVSRGESAIVVVARATPKPTPQPDFEDMTKEAKALRTSRVAIARPVHRVVKEVEQDEPAEETTERPYLAERTLIRHRADDSAFGAFKYSASFDNSFTVSQSHTVNEASGRDFVLRNELTVGAAGASGWGAKASLAFNSTMNVDTTEDYREFGDPSLTVSHPTLFRNRDLTLDGAFRYYLPFSYDSKLSSVHHFAYVLTAELALPSQLKLTNTFIPRYFAQSVYEDDDAYMMVFDSTELTKQMGSGVGLGLGQQTRYEVHHMTPAGTLIEAYPFVSYTGISNVMLQAKAFFPLVTSNVVGSAPLAAGVSNLQAEFFARISF